MQQTTKTKRVFHLRKTGSARANPPQQKVIDQQQPNQSQIQNEKYNGNNSNNNINTNNNKQQSIFVNNQSYKSQTQHKQQPSSSLILLSYPQLTMDKQELQFNTKIGNVQVQNIKIKNIGCSAIYYEWVFKNLPKINNSAIKDPKPNFYCHYQSNVIKPAQQVIFTFSFYSETPGIFVQEIELICTPEPATPIVPIRLKGNAYIEDTLKNKRQKLAKQLKQKLTEVFTKQVVTDIVRNVKSPVPPLPDVSNPQIAQKQFEQANANEKLYYNKQVHSWFTKLYNDICNQNKIPQEKRHWNQSIYKLAELIQNVKDPILKQSFDKRLQNYKSLSTTKPSQKSDLFPKIKQTLLQVGYSLGGSISDQSKKQLEMWQIPFEEPSQTQTQQQIAAKKDERTKIIGEWAKKMKKKKWGAQQENQMLNNYRGKLQKGVSKALIQKFDGFDAQANFESSKAKIKQKFDNKNYFGFLQRLKSVEQFPIQGKKILLKFDLKLKQNCGQALLKLEQYLQKKKQQQIRLQQQKKNQESSKTKKKAPPPKKKKGQKQEQQQKALTFDFNTLLDHQSWQGFTSTLKFILEKQPFLLIIGISYGPKTGVFTQKQSIKFLLECVKAIEPSIQFLEHKDLLQIKQKLQEQTLNEGSIYLTQNLSFLPCEGMQTGSIKIIQKIQNGETKKIQTIQSHKMLMSQVQKQLQILMPAIDIVVRQDRFVNRVSGICSYGKKTCILGQAWWKYIAFALRVQSSYVQLGGNFSPQKLVLIAKLTKYCNKLYLAGQLGIKIWMAVHGLQHFYGVKNSKNQQNSIKFLIQQLKHTQAFQKIVLPSDFLLQVHKQNQIKKINFKQGDKVDEQNTKVIDIGEATCHLLTNIQHGHLFIIDYSAVNKLQISSLQTLSKILYNKKQQKKLRHQQQQSTPAGINYQQDLVTYIIGIKQQDLQKIQLKQKKVKPKQGEQQQQQQQPQPEQEVKKIDQICDFRIEDVQFFNKLLAADFSYGLKDISKYPKSD